MWVYPAIDTGNGKQMRSGEAAVQHGEVTDFRAFGIELRRRRIALGVSLTQFARQVHYSKGHLSKIENGLSRPAEDFARRCDACLDAGGELAALVSATPAGRDGQVNTSPDGGFADGDSEVWLMGLGPNGESGFQPVGRRDVLFMGITALSTLSISGASSRRGRHGGEVLTMSRNLFDQTRRLGQTVRASLVFPVVVSQTQMLRSLSRSTPDVRPELMLLAARSAEFAGWMAQESGDDAGALWWTRKAVRMAGEAGMRELAAYALVREALITLYQRNGTATVALAQRAQQDALVPLRIRGLAAQREAQGHALLGAYDECMRALERAADLLARAAAEPRDGEPTIGTSNVNDPVAVVTGWCLHDLGRPREAAEILDREVARISPDATRARVRFGLRRALAHAAAGEVDHACMLTGQMLESVTALDSSTVRADVHRVSATLRRWSAHPVVRELTPSLSEALGPGVLG